MSKILPYYRRCFYTHSKSTQTLSSRKCAGIVVMYEGLIYHETYNEPWLYTRWRCQNFIPVEKGGKCRNILRELMYMIMTNKGYFWTWPFNFICYKTRLNPFTIQTKIRILTKQKQKHAPANSALYKDDFGKRRRLVWFCWLLTKVCITSRRLYPVLLGTLRSEDGDGRKNFAEKVNPRSFNLHRDYSKSLTLSNVGEPS